MSILIQSTDLLVVVYCFTFPEVLAIYTDCKMETHAQLKFNKHLLLCDVASETIPLVKITLLTIGYQTSTLIGSIQNVSIL